VSANLVLRESPFLIVNCLKSFDFKLFFVYTLNVLKGLFWHVCILFLLYFDKHDLHQSLLNVLLSLIWLEGHFE